VSLLIEVGQNFGPVLSEHVQITTDKWGVGWGDGQKVVNVAIECFGFHLLILFTSDF